MLAGDIKRAVSTDVDVILFNIDSKADSSSGRDAILRVFLKVFNEKLGYSGDHPHIADLERHLDAQGKLDAFKAAFRAAADVDWELERDGYSFYTDELVQALSEALGMSPGGGAGLVRQGRGRLQVPADRRELRQLGQGVPGQPGPGPPHHLPGGRDRPVHRPGHPPDAQPADHHREPRHRLRRPGLGGGHLAGGHRRRPRRGARLQGQRLLQDPGPLQDPPVALQRQRGRGHPEAPVEQDRRGPLDPRQRSIGTRPTSSRTSSASATSA